MKSRNDKPASTQRPKTAEAAMEPALKCVLRGAVVELEVGLTVTVTAAGVVIDTVGDWVGVEDGGSEVAEAVVDSEAGESVVFAGLSSSSEEVSSLSTKSSGFELIRRTLKIRCHKLLNSSELVATACPLSRATDESIKIPLCLSLLHSSSFDRTLKPSLGLWHPGAWQVMFGTWSLPLGSENGKVRMTLEMLLDKCPKGNAVTATVEKAKRWAKLSRIIMEYPYGRCLTRVND